VKKIIIRLALGLTVAAAAGLIIAGSASAIQMDTNTVATKVDQLLTQPASAMQVVDTNTVATKVDQLLIQMQQGIINKNYSTMLMKNQMRAQMMAERTPQNFMQKSIQPVMMETMRAQVKSQQMGAMMIR
jgi:hypothetical protein